MIVVIVILAILAAILIPGMLQWIDKAKQEQYGLDARNVYLATEAYIAEQYAAGVNAPGTTLTEITDGSPTGTTNFTYIKDLSGVSVTSVKISTVGNDAKKESWKITGMEIVFTPSNGGTAKKGTMNPNKTWTFSEPTT